MSAAARAARFRELHARGIFVIANAFDAGSARILAGLGFEAIATSSGAMANTLGRMDGRVTRAEAIAHGRAIVEAVDVPVSADLERGFGDAPADAAETIRQAGAAGLAGGSIEDSTGDKSKPIYDVAHAAERVAAAVEAARELPCPFVLTARAENFITGRPDLDDTIRRLQAFEKAGADVLFAPGLPTLDAVRTVCASVSRPVNFMVGIRGKSFSLAELEQAGVRRVSVATSLYRAAMSGLVAAAREIREHGTFGYVETGLASADLARFMRKE
ncbi:MAG TPA: isocitrate lyase/phosphoenolpyruvate mutase family protein [Usitatibacter sp.]|nr:isocitrate lyase/phosphoenolpyruvate mutase family protein [Usitatibacter sp.]